MKKDSDLIDYIKLGSNIKAARLRLGKRQTDISDVLDVSYTFYGKVERGSIKPNLERLVSICVVLEIPIVEVFRGAIRSENIQYTEPWSNDKYLHEFQVLLDKCTSSSSKETMVTVCKAILELENS